MWQRRIVEWLMKWAWAEACQEEHRISWIELLLGFEIETGCHVVGTELLSHGNARLLKAAKGIGQEVAAFRRACVQLLDDLFTLEAREMFVRRGAHGQKGAARPVKLGIRGAWARNGHAPPGVLTRSSMSD